MPATLTTGCMAEQPTRQKQTEKSGCRPGHQTLKGQNLTRTPTGIHIRRPGNLVTPARSASQSMAGHLPFVPP